MTETEFGVTDLELQLLAKTHAEMLRASGMVVLQIPDVSTWSISMKNFVSRHPDCVGAFIKCQYRPMVYHG